MKVKSVITIITIFSFLGLSQLMAQPKVPGEKLWSLKVGYLTGKLNLSGDEATSFWPIYKSFHDELEAHHKARRKSIRDFRQNQANMSDAELKKTADIYIDFHRKDLALKEKYHAKFKEALPVRKLLKLYKSEEQFKAFLLQKLREERKGEGRARPSRFRD